MTSEQLHLRQAPPLYAVAEKAAIISGLSKDLIKSALNDKIAPIPHLQIGNTKYVRISAIEPYFMTKEIS